MNGAEILAIVSVASSALVTLTVSFLGPRVTGRQQREGEREKYLREKRSEVYIDALAQVQGELLDFTGVSSILGHSKRAAPGREDRWNLNSRLALYGSPEFRRLWDAEWAPIGILVTQARVELANAANLGEPEETLESLVKEVHNIGFKAFDAYRLLRRQAANDVQGIKLPDDDGMIDREFVRDAAHLIPFGDSSFDKSALSERDGSPEFDN